MFYFYNKDVNIWNNVAKDDNKYSQMGIDVLSTIILDINLVVKKEI